MTEACPKHNVDVFLLIAAVVGFLLLISNPFYVIIGEYYAAVTNVMLQIILINILTLILGSSLIIINRLKFPKAKSELSVKLGFRRFVLGILMIFALLLCLPVFIDLLPFVLVWYGSPQFSIGVYLSLFYFALILIANILGNIEYSQVPKQPETSAE